MQDLMAPDSYRDGGDSRNDDSNVLSRWNFLVKFIEDLGGFKNLRGLGNRKLNVEKQ